MSLGVIATVTVTPVGFHDDYDFDAHGRESYSAQAMTVVGALGYTAGGDNFSIDYNNGLCGLWSYGDTCNNPQTSPDAAVPWVGRAHGRRGSAGSGSGWTLNCLAFNPVPEWQGQIGKPRLIGDERVTSHLLSPPPLEPDQRVQGKVRRP
jgi:hypothetical protein